MTILPSATSPDGGLVAVVAPSATTTASSSSNRCTIQIYDTTTTATTSLQLTLTHQPTTSTEYLRQLVFVGRSFVLGLFGTQQVVVWDLERGVVAFTHVLTPAGGDNVNDDDKAFIAISPTSTTTSTSIHAQQDPTSGSASTKYYILLRIGPKLLVHEYQATNHKLLRKIKSGKIDSSRHHRTPDGEASLVVTSNFILVRTHDHGVRIMDMTSGEKVGKIKTTTKTKKEKTKKSSSHDSSNTNDTMLSPTTMVVCGNNTNIVALVTELGTIRLYDIETTNELASTPPMESLLLSSSSSSESTNHGTFSLQVIQEGLEPNTDMDGNNNMENNVSFVVLCDRTVTRVSTNSTQTSNSQETTRLECVYPTSLILQGRYSNMDQSEDDDRLLALYYQSHAVAECRSQSIPITTKLMMSSNPSFHVGRQEDNKEDIGIGIQTRPTHDDTATTNKRRLHSKTTETDILGPGQAGNDVTMPVMKKRKVPNIDNDDDDDEAKELDSTMDVDDEEEAQNTTTIADRLQQLKDALDEEDGDEEDDDDDDADDDDNTKSSRLTFKPKLATTETLTELLSQSLQSSDDAMLELALGVRDTKMIVTTLRQLDDTLLVTLLSKLTTRLASSPLRAESLSVWISQCLKLGNFEPHHLSTLKNMLYERIESFSDLLRLEGRLSMMIELDD